MGKKRPQRRADPTPQTPPPAEAATQEQPSHPIGCNEPGCEDHERVVSMSGSVCQYTCQLCGTGNSLDIGTCKPEDHPVVQAIHARNEHVQDRKKQAAKEAQSE